MLERTLIFVVETLVQLWVLAVLLRLLAQLVRVPFRARAGNPLADFVFALTDWAIMPLRRVIPSVGKLDTATLVAAWLAVIALSALSLLLVGGVSMRAAGFWPGLFALSFVEVLRLGIYLLIGLLIVEAVLSWVNPYHPLRQFFSALTQPVLRPIRRMVPLVGGVDLSPLFAIIALQVVLMLPIAWLSAQAILLLRAGSLG
jgi:YggT family protein